MRKLSACGIAFFLFFPLARAQVREHSNLYLKAGYYDWTEIEFGKRSMNEHGPLYAVGLERKLISRKNISVYGNAELWGGLVRYDGSEQFTNTPSKTNSGYFGTYEELLGDVRMGSFGKASFGSLFGISHRAWFRTSGSECWNVVSLRFGTRITRELSSGRSFFVHYGTTLPVISSDYAFLHSLGYTNTNFKPKNHASPFLEFGLKFPDGRKVSISYEAMEFGSSHFTSIQNLSNDSTRTLYQPASKSYTIWIKVSRTL